MVYKLEGFDIIEGNFLEDIEKGGETFKKSVVGDATGALGDAKSIATSGERFVSSAGKKVLGTGENLALEYTPAGVIASKLWGTSASDDIATATKKLEKNCHPKSTLPDSTQKGLYTDGTCSQYENEEKCKGNLHCEFGPTEDNIVDQNKNTDTSAKNTLKSNKFASGPPQKLPPLSDSLKELQDTNMKNIINEIDNINDISGQLLYDKVASSTHLSKIKDLPLFTDLGKPENQDLLDFVEHVIIKFIDLSDPGLYNNFFKNYCQNDLNINIMLTLAILYHKNSSELPNIKDNNIIYIDTILNRLGKYLPDIFQKILTGMKACNPDSSRYIIVEHVYKTMFKFNNTTVNIGFMDSFNNFFNWVKDRHTIEIVVVIIAIAFVISKIFDMFRVKVEV